MHDKSLGIEVRVVRDPLRFSLRKLLLIVTVVALALFVFGWIWRAVDFSYYPDVVPRPFNANEWKAWSIEDMHQSEDIRRTFVRRDMLDDLLAKTNFTGMTPTQLALLLGPANPEFCPKEWDIAYLLGADFIDYVVLVFRVDRNGLVASQRVIEF
jgi:hypothetical protein